MVSKETELAFLQMIEVSKHVVSIGDEQVEPELIEALSEEQRILTVFAKAKNSNQVAKELRITLPTQRNHLHAFNRNLRLHNRLEAVPR